MYCVICCIWNYYGWNSNWDMANVWPLCLWWRWFILKCIFMGLIFWVLLLFFGWLFIGWEFFLYLIVGFIIFVFLNAFYPRWFDDWPIWCDRINYILLKHWSLSKYAKRLFMRKIFGILALSLLLFFCQNTQKEPSRLCTGKGVDLTIIWQYD